MTIAVGFVCSDGLIFASDSLYTGIKKEYGQKFWIIDKGDLSVVFGGAGTATSLKRTRDEIDQGLQTGMDQRGVIKRIEEALLYVEQQTTPAPEERTYALVGLRISNKSWLYENETGKSALTVLDRNSQSVGAGYLLGRYFCDVLFRSNMSMKWAKVVAAHLIKNVKIHNSVYCGGRTHIVELPNVGQARLTTDKAEIEGYESHLQQVDDAMRVVLPDGRANDDTLELRVRTIAEAIKKAASANVIRVEPGVLNISAGSSNVVAQEMPTPRITFGKIEGD